MMMGCCDANFLKVIMIMIMIMGSCGALFQKVQEMMMGWSSYLEENRLSSHIWFHKQTNTNLKISIKK